MSNLYVKNLFCGKEETLFSFNYIPCPNPTEMAITHLHTSYEILFFYEGDANYHIGGKIYHLIKNDLLIIKPSVYHNISLLSSRPYSRIVLNFYATDLPEAVGSFLQNSSDVYHIPEGSPVFQILEAMRYAFEVLPHEIFEQFFNYSVTNVLLLLPHVKSNAVIESSLAPVSTFDQILSYIDKNPDKPLTLDSLSETFFLSKSHISHLFKQKLQTSAMQYINRKKLSYAHTLLLSGIPPVQVAEKCSFNDYSTFYRLYKKLFGTMPKTHAR